jgi:hypothetical protein
VKSIEKRKKKQKGGLVTQKKKKRKGDEKIKNKTWGHTKKGEKENKRVVGLKEARKQVKQRGDKN